MYKRILVATDGKPGAVGALRTARWLSERDGSRVEVVAVYEPITLYGIGTLDVAAGTPGPMTQAAIDALSAVVRNQLAEIGGSAPDWDIEVRVGPKTPSIARFGARCFAEVIILGLAEGKGLRHWQSRETVVGLVHLAHLPVLAVPASVGSLPRTAVVAIDFSEFSIRAAREAAREMGTGGKLHLVHVLAELYRDGPWEPPGGWAGYLADLRGKLEDITNLLGPSGAKFETHILFGDPGLEILRLGSTVGADLIATGSHGSGFFGRLLLGSVAGAVIHRAPCSILAVPPPQLPPELQFDLTDDELLRGLGNTGEMLQDTGLPFREREEAHR
jgi:nucleotide-binding universal stress UspA family protein